MASRRQQVASVLDIQDGHKGKSKSRRDFVVGFVGGGDVRTEAVDGQEVAGRAGRDAQVCQSKGDTADGAALAGRDGDEPLPGTAIARFAELVAGAPARSIAQAAIIDGVIGNLDAIRRVAQERHLNGASVKEGMLAVECLSVIGRIGGNMKGDSDEDNIKPLVQVNIVQGVGLPGKNLRGPLVQFADAEVVDVSPHNGHVHLNGNGHRKELANGKG